MRYAVSTVLPANSDALPQDNKGNVSGRLFPLSAAILFGAVARLPGGATGRIGARAEPAT